MKLFILLIFLGVIAIGGFLGWRVLGLMKRVEQLKADKIRDVEIYNELREEKVKQSNQLRLKGIEIDELKKELDKYSEVEIKVALTGFEKQMILNALDAPHYKEVVETPKTKFFIREIYKKLKEKIKESIKE